MQIKEIKDFRVRALIPFDGNAKQHSPEQVQQIVVSMRQFGFYNPIIIDESGLIICGHGRRLACIEMNMVSVPVRMLIGATEAEVRAIRLADNKIAENGSWDFTKVREEMDALLAMEFDVLGIGFTDFEIETILRDDLSILPEDKPAPKKQVVDQQLSTDEELQPEKPPRKKRVAKNDASGSDMGDDYAGFELVMLQSNKDELIETLMEIQENSMFDRMEDALMYLVKVYKQAGE